MAFLYPDPPHLTAVVYCDTLAESEVFSRVISSRAASRRCPDQIQDASRRVAEISAHYVSVDGLATAVVGPSHDLAAR